MRLVEFDSHLMLVSESNYKNLKPLTIMAKEVLNQFQYIIDADEVKGMKVSFSDNIRNELEKYGDIFGLLCDYIEKNVPIYMVNKESGSLKGGYSHSAQQNHNMLDDVKIYLPSILGDKRAYRPSELQDKKVETTLVHELRHVMQRQQFGEYYHNKVHSQEGDDYNYRTDPIEIDAAFLHHLHDEEATNLKDFVNGVMDRFKKYKTLTDKQYKHYRRKAAAYYYANISPDEKPTSTPKERLAAKRKKEFETMASIVRDTDVEKLGDLRNVGSNDNGKFLINPNAFKSAVLGLIGGNQSSGLNYLLSVAFLGLMKKVNPDIPAKQIVSRLNIDVDAVVDGLKDADMRGFDKKLFINAANSLK